MDYGNVPPGTPRGFLYLLGKAERYLRLGPQIYRKADALNMPPDDSSEELLAAVQRGMEQICELRGWSHDKPFEGIGIEGFYALMSTLHFELEKQCVSDWDDAAFLDEMHMKHTVVERQIKLYNKVPKPTMR